MNLKYPEDFLNNLLEFILNNKKDNSEDAPLNYYKLRGIIDVFT